MLVVLHAVYVDVTLTRSKVKVKGLLNFRQLAKLCMLAVMTAAPLRGFLVTDWMLFLTPNQQCQSTEGNYILLTADSKYHD